MFNVICHINSNSAVQNIAHIALKPSFHFARMDNFIWDQQFSKLRKCPAKNSLTNK